MVVPLLYLAGPLFSKGEKPRLNPMVRLALDLIVDDEEALLRVLFENGAHIQPVQERSDERT